MWCRWDASPCFCIRVRVFFKVSLYVVIQPISVLSCVLSDLMEMVMAMVRMKGATTLTPKVEEMPRATQEKLLLTRETPEVEDAPQLSEEPPWWESKGSHVSITGGPHIRIRFNRTPPKWNHTIARGGPLHQGRTGPPMSSINHPLAVLHKDPLVKGVHLSTATPQVTGHPPQDIFATTQLIGGLARHRPPGAPLGVIKGSQVFCIRSSGTETHVGITVPEKGPMSTLVMAWSVGTRVEHSLIHTMENMGPHREAQERCMGEAQCQRGTGVKPQSQLGKIVKEEA